MFAIIIFFSISPSFIKKTREAHFRIESFINQHPPEVKCQLQERNCTGVQQRCNFKTQCFKLGYAKRRGNNGLRIGKTKNVQKLRLWDTALNRPCGHTY